MKNKETLDLVLKAQKGDKVALDQLVEANVGLVWSIVHRFKNTYYDKEDLFQIGCIKRFFSRRLNKRLLKQCLWCWFVPLKFIPFCFVMDVKKCICSDFPDAISIIT